MTLLTLKMMNLEILMHKNNKLSVEKILKFKNRFLITNHQKLSNSLI